MASMFDRARIISTKEIIIGAVVVIAVAILVAFIAGIGRMHDAGRAGDVANPSYIPPFTPEIAAQLEKSIGFSALLSYTDRGFEPTSVTIGEGEAVRFTNNSSRELWVASMGTDEYAIYPGPGACGQSALDTCHSLAPRVFWEFTFAEAGTWQITNNLNKDDVATVTVAPR